MHRFKVKYRFFSILLFSLGIIPMTSYAQDGSSFFEGFGIELGGGYNQLFWEATNLEGNKESYNRTSFSFRPSFRLSYDLKVFQNINLYSFAGYNEFGGRRKLEESRAFLNPDVRYQDQYIFRSLEAGVLGSYSFSGVSVGIGAKVNYHIDIEQKYYYENHPQGTNGWNSDDGSFFFNEWSYDAGIRIEYPLHNKIILGAEGWFGLTDLGIDELPIFVRENHFRVMIGYRF